VIVVVFRFECRPETTEEVRAALEDVIAVSRELDGVVTFDIARDLANENAFVATEVYVDRAALDRQMELPEVVHALALIRDSVTSRNAVIYDVREQPAGG
jgi:quinol monooxygenase YgiN